MRAVLLTTGGHTELEPLTRYRPSSMLNVADKPILFHIIESLVAQGIRHFDLILCHLPEQIEEKLQDGKRWGIQIEYHLCRNERHPFAALAPIAKNWKNETILIGQADEIPHLPFLAEIHYPPPILFFLDSGKWSGWGVFTADFLAELPHHVEVDHLAKRSGREKAITVKEWISSKELKKLVDSNLRSISEEKSPALFPTTAKKVESGVWISRAVILEPGVQVIPPVFVGENSHLKAGAKIGPEAIIENHSIVDCNSIIEHSLICQNSYVGEALEVRHCIVDRNSLINLVHGTCLEVKEDFILGSSSPPPVPLYLFETLERAVSLFLWIIFLPVYLWMRLSCEIKKEEILLIPSSQREEEWKTFTLNTFAPRPGKAMNNIQRWFQRLPTLLNVVRRELHLVGVPPRSPRETRGLPPEWRTLYLQSKAGLITLADVEHHGVGTSDELYAAEVLYAAQMGWRFDIKLICRWTGNLLFPKKEDFI